MKSPPEDTPEGARSLKRPARIRVEMDATLIASDGVESPVTLLDLSSAGFRLGNVRDPLEPGDKVQLLMRQERATGEIRWVLGEEAGGIFLTPHALG